MGCEKRIFKLIVNTISTLMFEIVNWDLGAESKLCSFAYY